MIDPNGIHHLHKQLPDIDTLVAKTAEEREYHMASFVQGSSNGINLNSPMFTRQFLEVYTSVHEMINLKMSNTPKAPIVWG